MAAQGHPQLRSLGEELFERFPSPTLIVDADVVVQHANRAARELLGLARGTESLLRRRGGELLHCIHSFGEGGCGRQPICEDCVIRHAVGNAMACGQVHRNHTTLEMRTGTGVTEASFLVSAAPIDIGGETQVILTLEDVTHIDRLERQVGRVEDALVASQSRIRQVFESMSEAFALHEVILDGGGAPRDYRFLDINPAFERLTGLTRSQVVGRLVTEALPGLDPHWIQTYGRVALTGEPAQFDRWEPILGRRYEVLAFRPAPGEFATLFRDVTERTRVADALAASESHLKKIVTSLQVPIALSSVRGEILEINPRFTDVLGYTIRDIPTLEDWFRQAYPDHEYRRRVCERWNDSVATAVATSTEVLPQSYRVTCKDGQERTMLISGVPLGTDMLVALLDITDRVRAEEAIRASEERFRSLIEQSSDITMVVDEHGALSFVSPAFETITGVPAIAAIGRSIREFIHRDDVFIATGAFMAARTSPGAVQRVRVRVRRGDGSWAILSAQIVDMLAVAAVRGVVINSRDVTERAEAEQTIRDSEAHLKRAEDVARLGHWVRTLGSHVIQLSEGAAHVYGLVETDVPVEDLNACALPEFRSVLDRAVRDAIETGTPVDQEFQIRRPSDGQVRDVHGMAQYDADSRRVFGVIQDVTERKRAENALQESERALLLSQKIAQVGSYEFDVRGDNWTSSQVLDGIFGIDDNYPRKASGWLQIIHPEDRAEMAEYLADLLACGSRFDHEYRILNQNTGEMRWVHGLGELERHPDGHPSRLVGTIQDITSRRVADEERRVLQGKLALASRLAAMGTLVAGVAHEINNPLAVQLTGQGLALEVAREARSRRQEGARLDVETEIRLLGEVIEALEDAQEGGQRVAQIVRDMAALASPDSPRTRVRMSDIVSNTIRRLPAFVSRIAAVQVESHEVPDVMASPGQIEQVLMNLVTNAAKATPDVARGLVVIRLGTGAAGMVSLEVIDQGTGIDPAIRGRIFEPFFTTRPVGDRRGTGLGLAVCHAIVTAHGGTITFESEVGTGSTFRVELPEAPELA